MSDLERIEREAKERREARHWPHEPGELNSQAEAAIDELIAMVKECEQLLDGMAEQHDVSLKEWSIEQRRARTNEERWGAAVLRIGDLAGDLEQARADVLKLRDVLKDYDPGLAWERHEQSLSDTERYEQYR